VNNTLPLLPHFRDPKIRYSYNMKKSLTLILVLTFLFLFSGCGGEVKKTFWENGNIKSKRNYKDDKLSGLSTMYYATGETQREENYSDGILSGLQMVWYKNGKKKREVHYKDWKIDGLYAIWYENGKKESERHFKNGKTDGLLTNWYENGKKESEVHYKDGKIDGLWTDWDVNGKKKSETYFKNEKIDGLYSTWYENGKKESEVHYKDDKRDGLWTDWDENGKKKRETHYKGGKIDGLLTNWYENGKKESEVHYKDDKRDGLWTDWDENGKKKSETYFKNEKIDGLLTNWYENGKKESEVHYKDDKRDGLWTDWDENGKKKRETHYKGGKIDGLYSTWYENGKKETERHFKNGKTDGLLTTWYENGKKESEVHYKDDKRDGLWTDWDVNGKKKRETHYKDGKIDGFSTTWYENGKVKNEDYLISSNEDYWVPEDPLVRFKLPLYKTIPAAKLNELTPANGYPQEDSYINWHRSHGDLGSSRFSLLDQINKSNVKDLEVAWIYRSKESDGATVIQANPVIANGVMYIPTPGHSIAAIDASNGEEIWKFKSPARNPALRGLIWWKGTKNHPPRLYFPAGEYLFALDAKTGKVVESFGKNGRIKSYQSKIAPSIAKDMLINATFRPSVDAYDIITGKLIWTFDLLEKAETSFPGGKPYHLANGNPWAGMSMDEKRGIAFISTGNPFPQFFGINRPGRNKHANSVVAIDIKSGTKKWSFQEIRHDIWDLDIGSPPILASITREGKRIDVVATVTKMGNTLLLDRLTGNPIYDFRLKRAPTSTVPGEKTWPYQPSLQLPEPFAKQEFSLNDVTNIGTVNRDFVLGKLKESNFGFFTPPGKGKGNVYFGMYGGAEWPGATVDQKTGILYVSSNDLPTEFFITNVEIIDETSLPKTEGREIFLSKCAFCHGLNREGLGGGSIEKGKRGPSLINIGLRLSKEEIREIIINGLKSMPPIEGISEPQLNSLVKYLVGRDREVNNIPNKEVLTSSKQYSLMHRPFLDNEDYPANKPPWGTLNAINLNTGKLLWKVPLGENKELKKRGLPATGLHNFGGPTVTAGGLVFIAGTKDKKIRAFDKLTGEELWAFSLPFSGSAPPATYELNGRQYVVIPATGIKWEGKGWGESGQKGDAFVAFSLPKCPVTESCAN
jgi:quinoprotein glucose dehydrogenase